MQQCFGRQRHGQHLFNYRNERVGKVNTCVFGTTHTQHRIEHNVEAYQTVDGRKRKTVQYDGKVRPSGVVDVVRVWVGEGRRWENTGVGSKREEEKKKVSGEPGVLFLFVCLVGGKTI